MKSKRRIVGLIFTILGIPSSSFTLWKSITLERLANSQFPPIEDAWQSMVGWVFPTALSVAFLFWGIIMLLATDKYWKWLMKSNDKTDAESR